MNSRERFSTEEAQKISERLGRDWSRFDVEHSHTGMDVELEHDTIDPKANVTNDDPLVAGKIALAHLNEFPDSYTRLKRMEAEAEAAQG